MKTFLAIFALSMFLLVEGTYPSTWDDRVDNVQYLLDRLPVKYKFSLKAELKKQLRELGIDISERRKRSADRDDSHFCCNKTGVSDRFLKQEVIRAKVVTKILKEGQSIKCGLWGLSRCTKSGNRPITVTEYYVDYMYQSVSGFEDGCPDANIACCAGYAYYTALSNCLTFQELENSLAALDKYDELYFKLANHGRF